MNSVIRKGTLVYTVESLRPVNASPPGEMLAHLINAQCIATIRETVRRLESADSIGNTVDILTTAARQLEDRQDTVVNALERLSSFPSQQLHGPASPPLKNRSASSSSDKQ